MMLHDAVSRFGSETPDAPAVQDPDGETAYGQLDRLSNQIAHGLVARGVRKGDRVALWLDKCSGAVAAMQAALRLGAAYVPVDPLSPTFRVRQILADCEVATLVTTRERLGRLELDTRVVATLCLDNGSELCSLPDGALPDAGGDDGDLAYILYTSGSTGRPKGVCISHRNALAFVLWAAQEFGVTSADRLSNHAPFHFDLSVFDLYAAFQVGATVCLIPDEVSFSGRHLVEYLVRERITIWYSVPSAIVIMMDHGGLLRSMAPDLRALLFAGEVFPINRLRELREARPSIRLANLYGPTETNVCTFYDVGSGHMDWSEQVPIGHACSGDTVWAQNETGPIEEPGQEGELMVSGPTVMLGYWGAPAQYERPYATGDLVRLLPGGGFRFVGRRDHLTKVRGHRIDLGEIELTLQQHPSVREVAVMVAGSGLAAYLVAFVVQDGNGTPSLLELKEYCAVRLPRYMIVNQVRYLAALPRTRNGKVDRSSLAGLLAPSKGDAVDAR
jgi:amino acid adenylation domain-containing protein